MSADQLIDEIKAERRRHYRRLRRKLPCTDRREGDTCIQRRQKLRALLQTCRSCAGLEVVMQDYKTAERALRQVRYGQMVALAAALAHPQQDARLEP